MEPLVARARTGEEGRIERSGPSGPRKHLTGSLPVPAITGSTAPRIGRVPYRISNWTITWEFAAGQTTVEGTPHSADVVRKGTTVTARPLGPYNAVLAPGASTTWGFHGTHDGRDGPAPAIACAGPNQGSSTAGPVDVVGAAGGVKNRPPGTGTSPTPRSPVIFRRRRPVPSGTRVGPGADEYFRQTSTATSEKQPVDFAAFSRRIEAVGGQKLVTVDGGSDTPQGAAAWVEESEKSGQGVALGGSWATNCTDRGRTTPIRTRTPRPRTPRTGCRTSRR